MIKFLNLYFSLYAYTIIDCCQTWNAFEIEKMDGCAPNCCISVHNVNVMDILTYHSYFEQLSKEAKQKWLNQYFNNHSSTAVANGQQESEISYFVSGKSVCRNVWVSSLGISTSTFYNARKRFLSGSVSIVREMQRSPQLKTNEAIAWMQNYFDLVGDKLPHLMSVHLPSNLSKLTIYQRMTSEFRNRKESSITISQSNFFRIWEEHFPDVIIPKVRI